MKPTNIQLIGNELCILWEDGNESCFAAEDLRRHSPSAQNIGERDIFGQRYGGDGPKDFPGVQITHWEIVGNYALRPTFSDGHNSGLYSWDFLQKLSKGNDSI
ncbi:MAG: gamma-butyrobetaine hydroxylase-like domain-containing protein [Opitutales bacterium]